MQVLRTVHRDVRVSATRTIPAQDFAGVVMGRYAHLWRRWTGLSLIFRRVRPIFLYDVAFESHASPIAVQQWQIIQQMSKHLHNQIALLNVTNSPPVRAVAAPSVQIVNRMFMQRVHFHTEETRVLVVPKDRIVFDGSLPEAWSQLRVVHEGHADVERARWEAEPERARRDASVSATRPPSNPRIVVQPRAQRQPMVVRHNAPSSAEDSFPGMLESRIGEPVAARMTANSAPVDLNILTEKVIRAIDQKVIAQRERMGRI